MSREELEKLTAVKLRELAAQYEEIAGAHAMKKDELVVAILKARGEPIKKEKKGAPTIAGIKRQIRSLKQEKAQLAKDPKKVAGLRKKSKKMKRLTRALAGQKTAAEG